MHTQYFRLTRQYFTNKYRCKCGPTYSMMHSTINRAIICWNSALSEQKHNFIVLWISLSLFLENMHELCRKPSLYKNEISRTLRRIFNILSWHSEWVWLSSVYHQRMQNVRVQLVLKWKWMALLSLHTLNTKIIFFIHAHVLDMYITAINCI